MPVKTTYVQSFPEFGYQIRTIESTETVLLLPDAADDAVTDIGFCEDTQLWYGWRSATEDNQDTIRGFGIGSATKKPQLPTRVKIWRAKTLDDARLMAIAFATN